MFLVVKMDFGSVEKYWGLKQKHKKQPFSDASASHLSLVLWHVWFQAVAWISHTTSPTSPSYEVGGIAKRIKTARLRRKTKLGRDTSRPPIILILYWISIIWRGREISRPYHTKSFLGDLMRLLSKKSFYHQGFFAVKRRAVFILGAKWIALVRGWRSDCVVGGMETRFQWRKTHSRTAKCEAFHVAPRLFFMFFVFDSIHNSATMHNLSPVIFHWTLIFHTCWPVDS